MAAVLSFWQARSAKRSALEAAEQTRIAALAADAAERQATAAETSAASAVRQTELAEQAATRYAPPWRLAWDTGDTYRLSNDGDEPAYGVKVAGKSILRRRFGKHATVDAHSAVLFLAADMDDRDITVTWHRHPDLDDPPRQWTCPLPRRP